MVRRPSDCDIYRQIRVHLHFLLASVTMRMLGSAPDQRYGTRFYVRGTTPYGGQLSLFIYAMW